MSRSIVAMFICLCLGAGLAGENSQGNLLANGGFEDWSETEGLKPQVLNQGSVAPLPEASRRIWPVGWQLGWTCYERDLACGSSLSRDEQVRHGGRYSLRIDNARITDVGFVQYDPQVWRGQDASLAVRPNRQYQLRWWVKGREVQNREAGAILMLYYVSGEDSRRTYLHEPEIELPRGTFDWQRRTFTFTTDDSARSLWFSLQLRRASGTVWYDDVELIELGPVVRVETY